MRLSQAVENQLAALTLPLAAPVKVRATVGREQAVVELAELDRLGASVRRVAVASPVLADVELESLQGQDRYFYELWLRRGGELELVRWHTEPAAGIKEQVPMQLTREILLRLVGDFEQAIRQVEQEPR